MIASTTIQFYCSSSEMSFLKGVYGCGKQQWPQDWKRSVFTPVAKKGNPKEC